MRGTHAFPMGNSDPVVAAHKCGNRYRLRRGECRVPPGRMFDAGDFLAVLAFVGPRNLVPDEFLVGVRMLAFGQTSKVVVLDRPGETMRE